LRAQPAPPRSGFVQLWLAADEISLALGFAAEAWYVGRTTQMAWFKSVCWTTATVIVACLGCSPAKTRATQLHAASAVDAQKPKGDFRLAVATLEADLKVRAKPLVLDNGESVAGGWMFETSNGLDYVSRTHDRLLADGAYLLLIRSGFDQRDVLGLLSTTDKYDVLRILQTKGNSSHTHDEVIAWLKDIDRTDPFLLVGASYDAVDLFFVEPVHDAAALAKSVLAFCPDFYSQGIGLDPANHGADPVFVVEQNLKTERLVHFWWD